MEVFSSISSHPSHGEGFVTKQNKVTPTASPGPQSLPPKKPTVAKPCASCLTAVTFPCSCSFGLLLFASYLAASQLPLGVEGGRKRKDTIDRELDAILDSTQEGSPSVLS